jgi:hypothetical protein
VSAEYSFVAFKVEKAPIVVFELPLDQEVRSVTGGCIVK